MRQALADGNYDRVIISTLPRRVSKWLRRDLPKRVAALGVPVDVITPPEGPRARELFAAVPGVIVQDEPASHDYPLATTSAGRDEIFVGRVRRDVSVSDDRGLAFWVVSDNLRKGAATYAVQLAEQIVARGLIQGTAGPRAGALSA